MLILVVMVVLMVVVVSLGVDLVTVVVLQFV